MFWLGLCVITLFNLVRLFVLDRFVGVVLISHVFFSVSFCLLLVFSCVRAWNQNTGTEYLAHGKKCCCEYWNLLELFNMLLFVLYFILTLLGYGYLEHEKTTEFIDYVDLAYPFEMAEWVLTTNM